MRQKIIDPVCGMDVSAYPDTEKISLKEKEFSFCMEGCKDRFMQKPDFFQGEPLIRFDSVDKIFYAKNSNQSRTATKVLGELCVRIWKGDFVAIIGPSGSGKSTVLNIMGLLDRPTSGRVFLNGTDTSLLHDNERAELRSKTFGFVFQQYNLIPWLNAYENAALPLVFSGRKNETEKLIARFREIGLEQRLTHRPAELSGGEQQRTALLRALANDPEIILGDEPTGNLDSATGNKILELLINLNTAHKKTLIIVTHDADIANKADQVITLKDGNLVRNHRIHRKTYTE